MAALDTRSLYLDRSPGEARGVVTLHGRPERLLVERENVDPGPRLGDIWRGRVRRLAPAFSGAFVDLGLEKDGFLKTGALPVRVAEGLVLEAVVLAEPRADKGPVLGFRAASEGRPARVAAGPTLEQQLRAAARQAPITEGEAAREAADLAEDEVLASVHPLPGGIVLTIERTRALTAIDIDLSTADANRRRVALANEEALRHAARLLRLKALGGITVIDLVGRPKDVQAIQRVAREAFHADEPGVIYGQVSRSGTFEIARPHRERPRAELLCEPMGRLSARSVAQRLARALEREGRADPGARLQAVCAPEVALELRPILTQVGPRFSVLEELGRERSSTDIQVL